MQPPEISSPPPQPLHGRVVLVTGGAQGIGRGIAQAALGAGACVMIADRDAKAGRATLDEWQLDERAAFSETDVANEAAVQAMVAETLARFGALDGLVNNAGIAAPETGPIEQLALSEWERRIAVDLTSAFLCCKHAFPALRAAAGAVVNIASTRALQSEPNCEAYAAAKGGLVALTHALALSAGPDLRVNCISPGWIATADWASPEDRHPPDLSEQDHRQHPVGRVGTPEDIGALAVWLLSPAAGFVTGQHFIVDGGMTRKMQYV
jgi:NAD(P)-dependent dehydrogenase (short-subunit alcohol dehydrogenase family)